ncbi:hypothetical protein ACFX13_035092 [Malus domestica]
MNPKPTLSCSCETAYADLKLQTRTQTATSRVPCKKLENLSVDLNPAVGTWNHQRLIMPIIMLLKLRRRRWWRLCQDDGTKPASLEEFLEMERRFCSPWTGPIPVEFFADQQLTVMNLEYDYLFKLLLIGDSGVGKLH